MRGIRLWRASRVTRDPSPCQRVAISTPTPPPPTTARRPGTVLESVPCRLVQGLASSMPGRSGSTGSLPVATATACRAVSVWDAPLSRATVTRRGPSIRPWPRKRSAPMDLTHSACPLSSQSAT